MKKGALRTILINIAVIAMVVVAIAIASHFFLLSVTRHSAHREVPNLTGLSLSEAQQLASESDLTLYINDSLYVTNVKGGTVLDQLPESGVEVKPGRTIYLIINAFGRKMVRVPYVAGHSLRQAKNILEVAGLEIEKLVYTDDMATNYVLEASYNGRSIGKESTTEAVVGDGVVLKVGVSREKDPSTRIPSLIGLTLKEAKSRVWESGLNLGTISHDKSVASLEDTGAKVYYQAVPVNSTAAWGSKLSLRVSNDTKVIEEAVAQALKDEIAYEKMQREMADSVASAERDFRFID